MGKKDGKSGEIRTLRKKLSKLRKKVKEIREEVPVVSPLAPAAFPALPVIEGIRFGAAAAGVKNPTATRLDVMLAEIAPGSSVAGVFTRSLTRSAPVRDCEMKLAAINAKGPGRGGFAIIVNSGNSNAFTGGAGVTSVDAVTGAVAARLKLSRSHVFSASTGVIGQPLPHDRILAVIDGMAEGLSETAGELAARAIMTTDTFAKGAVAEVALGDEAVRIAGFAKGSGMIAPDMATMLVYLFTDARISQTALQAMVSSINRDTFNAITVDGDTSTSDSLMMAATCRKGPEITGPRSLHGRAFAAALRGVMLDLAHQVVRDGEGATKFVEVEVTGATSRPAARKVALAIANSPLVKTAIAGQDPNWGRIVMAVGKAGAKADRDLLTIRFGDLLVAEKGWVSPDYREEDGATYFRRDELVIRVDLGLGKGAAKAWTCDLTHRYISINADYRS